MNATERNKVIRECIAFVNKCANEHVGTGSEYDPVRYNAIHGAACDMRALLSPTDQGEAGTQQPDWTPCERTVRLCIETLPDVSATSAADMQAESVGIERCREALESLLPAKDPAEELVREWESTGVAMTRDAREGAYWLASWLVSKEKLA